MRASPAPASDTDPSRDPNSKPNNNATPNSNQSSYPRLLAYAFRFKTFFLLSVMGFALFATMQTLLLRALELFVNLLGGKSTEWTNYLPDTISESIYLLPGAILVLSLFRGIGYYFGHFYISRVGLNVVNVLRKQVFDHLLFVPQKVYDTSNSGEQISLVIYNIEQVKGSVTNAVKIFFEDGLFLVGLLIFMLYLNWQLTLAFFVATPILSGLVFVAARYFRKVSRKIQLTVGRVTHITNETIQAIQTVKSYNAEKVESNRFQHAADENLKYSTKFERVNALQTPIMHFVISISLAAIFLLVLLLWPPGDPGGAVAFVTAAGATAKPVRQLSTINGIIQRGLAAAETIFAVLDTDIDLDTGTTKLTNAKGDIVFSDVGFHYNADQPVLTSLNLDIRAGQTVALVGPSGSGKSTIANLLLRFYRTESGTISIDDHNINELTLSSLREHIAIVSQSATLFDTSIAQNVAYGSGEVNTARLHSALKHANAYDFVMKLEHGIETNVGEGGNRLSGGQRQRIAIARAIYKDAPILLLDEATSALDNESEKLIQEALDTLKQGRTTLIIAHRLSTVRNADNIVVLDHGRIIEMGDHDALLEKNGVYAGLYNTQSTLS